MSHDPAFPTRIPFEGGHVDYVGLTRYEWFLGQAIIGILSAGKLTEPGDIVRKAKKIAALAAHTQERE